MKQAILVLFFFGATKVLSQNLFPNPSVDGINQSSMSNNQKRVDKFYIAFGYTEIPLHIERTKATRWMLYPTFEGNYRINNQFQIAVTYLSDDVTLNNSNVQDLNRYKEIPNLATYNEAVQYLGKRLSLPVFSNYCFAGIQCEYFGTRTFKLQFGAQIGFRFGEYYILSFVNPNPSKPNGSDLHASLKSSNSPGFRLAISPKLVLGDLLCIGISMGSFTFFNWPVVQPYGNAQIGLSF